MGIYVPTELFLQVMSMLVISGTIRAMADTADTKQRTSMLIAKEQITSITTKKVLFTKKSAFVAGKRASAVCSSLPAYLRISV